MNIGTSFLKWWKEHCTEYDAIFFDVDGCLISGKHALPGAIELIEYLRNTQFPFCLLTNDGNNSIEEKCGIMKRRGLNISTNELISCSSALTPLAKEKGYIDKKFFVMGELGNPDFAELAGIKVVRDTSKIGSCSGIIIGEGSYNWQPNINAVINYYIQEKSSLMIVPNPDSYWPNGLNGEIGIGAGGKARFLCTILREYGIKIKPLYLGKPYNPVYRCALKHLRELFNLPREVSGKKILMLGDSLLSDIRGANRVGFSSGLLLTGITNMNHVKKARKNCQPDLIFKSL
jgi:HAD superfamily hydrolase (TIGR01450 family)